MFFKFQTTRGMRKANQNKELYAQNVFIKAQALVLQRASRFCCCMGSRTQLAHQIFCAIFLVLLCFKFVAIPVRLRKCTPDGHLDWGLGLGLVKISSFVSLLA